MIDGNIGNPPLLGNIVNKQAGTMTKYKYSEVMKKSKIIWNRENLYNFLRSP